MPARQKLRSGNSRLLLAGGAPEIITYGDSSAFRWNAEKSCLLQTGTHCQWSIHIELLNLNVDEHVYLECIEDNFENL